MTRRPIMSLLISHLPVRRAFCSTRTIISSICSGVIGRLWQALIKPPRSLSLLNDSLLPSFFITTSSSSAFSYVVKRLSHFVHSRRRRTSSSLTRLSITFVSWNEQNGQFIVITQHDKPYAHQLN